MTRTASLIKNIVLLAGDVGVLYLALYLALLTRYGSDFNTGIWHAHTLPFSLAFALWIVIFHIGGLYSPTITKNDLRFYTVASKTVAFAIGATMIVFYLLPSLGIAPKTNLLL